MSANGTTEANKVLTADANKDVTAIRNLTATGDTTVGGSVTATGTVTRALTRGSIDVGNSSENTYVERNSIDDIVSYITGLLDEVINDENLPGIINYIYT